MAEVVVSQNGMHAFFIGMPDTDRCEPKRRPVLGVFRDWHYQDCLLRLHAGDRLLLFTDGITEAANASNEEFSEQRLIEVAQRSGSSAGEVKTQLLAKVNEFCDSQLRDDATLIVIEAAAVSSVASIFSSPLA